MSTQEHLITIPQRLGAEFMRGYESEFMSAVHDYPENEHLRDAYEMGIKQCRDELRMEDLRIG